MENVTATLALIGVFIVLWRTLKKRSLKRAEDAPKLNTESGIVPYRVIHRDEGENLPLFIGLHGFGADERQMESLVGIKPRFPHVYVAPRGFHKLDERSFGWFSMSVEGTTPTTQESDLRAAIVRLHEVIEGLAGSFASQRQRVYLLGYSQGSAIALMYALAHPEILHGVVAFNGCLSREMKLASARQDCKFPGLPIFYGNGSRDPLITSAQVENTRTFLHAHGHQVWSRTYNAPHVVSAAGRGDIERFLEESIDPESDSQVDSKAGASTGRIREINKSETLNRV